MHVLFLGNGFDLYHNLKTSYLDFLELLKYRIDFRHDVDYYLSADKDANEKRFFSGYFSGIDTLDEMKLKKLCKLLENPWADYYSECNADIQGWIDFENEMNPVFDMLRHLFNGDGDSYSMEYLMRSSILRPTTYKEHALAAIWDTYFLDNEDRDGTFSIVDTFFDESYGLLKESLLGNLEKHLNDFMMAFILYLQLFVESKSIDKFDWIQDLAPTNIISFNYTQTEQKYYPMLSSNNCAHIHGTTANGNIVLGTDLIKDDDVDFMHFSKRFQRLCKVADFSTDLYIESFDSLQRDWGAEYGGASMPPTQGEFNVSFIGCSLDKNDSPIFKKYIEKSDCSTIYCYGFSDYMKAIGNLISIFGSDFVTKYMRTEKLKFYDIMGLEKTDLPKEISPKDYYRNLMET